MDCGLILLYNDAWKDSDDSRFLELCCIAQQIYKNLLNSSLIKVQFFLAFSADVSDLKILRVQRKIHHIDDLSYDCLNRLERQVRTEIPIIDYSLIKQVLRMQKQHLTWHIDRFGHLPILLVGRIF